MKRAKKLFSEPCGCKYTARGWESLCEKHEQEVKQVHLEWARQHQEKMKEKHHE